MEKPSAGIDNPETKESKKFKKNVEIHVFFIRHAKKALFGKGISLFGGRKQAKDFSKNLTEMDTIKGYTSIIKRAQQTIKRIITKSQHSNKKMTIKIKKELGFPEKSEEFKANRGKILKEWTEFGIERPAAKTASIEYMAELFGSTLKHYFDMAYRLKEGLKVDIVNVTHQGFSEALLSKVLKRSIDNEIVDGFKSLNEVGGPLKNAEGIEFIIKTDDEGNPEYKIKFRGQEHDININELNKLVESYKSKQKQTKKIIEK